MNCRLQTALKHLQTARCSSRTCLPDLSKAACTSLPLGGPIEPGHQAKQMSPNLHSSLYSWLWPTFIPSWLTMMPQFQQEVVIEEMTSLVINKKAGMLAQRNLGWVSLSNCASSQHFSPNSYNKQNSLPNIKQNKFIFSICTPPSNQKNYFCEPLNKGIELLL